MQDVPALLRDLPDQAFGFLLVIARVGTTLLTGPGLGEADIPATIRAALAVVLAALVMPMLRTSLPHVPDSLLALLGLVVLEIVVGAWMGFMCRVLVMSLAMAGGIMSLMVGLSSVLQIDPSVGTQVAALQRMLGLAAIALLFASGLYLLPIEAIVGSYDLIPPGAAFDAAGGAQLVTGAVSDSFALALRLAAPFVVIALVWNVALGFISRLIPAIQMHVVSAPAQIIGGLGLLTVAIFVIFTNWSIAIQASLAAMPGL
jgi:flagellar biosynthetic protein FliR